MEIVWQLLISHLQELSAEFIISERVLLNSGKNHLLQEISLVLMQLQVLWNSFMIVMLKNSVNISGLPSWEYLLTNLHLWVVVTKEVWSRETVPFLHRSTKYSGTILNRFLLIYGLTIIPIQRNIGMTITVQLISVLK